MPNLTSPRHPKIVGTGPIDQVAIDILRPFGEVVVAPNTKEESVIPLLDEAVALVVRGDGKVTARLIAAGRHLKVIARSGVGYENVDIAVASERKIPVVYTPGAGARAVAEAAMALMLALCKHIVHWDQQLKAGNWKSRHQMKNGDLDDATLGIIGAGRIGQLLAQMARPFNMTVLAYDPYADAERAAERGIELVPLDDLLKQADFISLHAVATDETRGLINRQRLKLIKRGSYLVNLARGQLIDGLDCLYEAMQDGRLAGVGLDVFDPEPARVNHPIFELPNCLTAPHALAMTYRAMERVFRSMAEDIAAVLTGKQPRFVVNPEVMR